jgi:signal transduction histidine kinase/DNA-binding LytR/AlgR family response regulator
MTLSTIIAVGGVLAVLLGTALMFREARAARRGEAQLAADRAALAHAYTELAQAKARAEAQTAQLQAVLGGMSDGVCMFDADLNLVIWNDRYGELTGVPGDQLQVGTPMEQILRAQAEAGEFGPMADLIAVEAEVTRRMLRLRSFREPGVVEHERPNRRTLELRLRTLPGGGFVTLFSDVSARRQAEAAQREARRVSDAAVAQKAQFVAMVSHEIRVPLNAVLGNLMLLEQSDLSAPQRGLVATARQSGDVLMALVHDILDLARIDSGTLTLTPQDTALRPLLEGVCDLFHEEAATRGIRFALAIDPAVPDQIEVDSARLRQLLANLVGNAAKYARPGTVTLAADVSEAAGRTLLRVAVCDPGPRIPAAEAASLFQPFARIGVETPSGTGLGLAICARLVGLMGGGIGLNDPSPDLGAVAAPDGNVFWFSVPVGDAQSRRALLRDEARRRPPRAAHVLLVEDVASNRLLTAAMLRRAGHRVDMAESGADALRMVTLRPYDVVFMDLHMPGLDGVATARRIRALPGPEACVPIVAVTGGATNPSLSECDSALMQGILAKPIRPEQLIETLARLQAPRRGTVPRLIASSDTAVGLLDTERLAELQHGLPPGVFAGLVEQCLTDLRSRAGALSLSIDRGEPIAAAAAAHAIAGLAGSYGLAAVARRVREVQLCARQRDLSAAREIGAGLETELDRSADALRTLLQPHAA